jgi:phosphopantothenoylcysteine decarboxylase/phosphopantothenate--cysteine ligase
MKKMNSKKSSPTGRLRVILGVTGGIAAIKSARLAGLLAETCEVRVIMTPSALRFITELPFQAVTSRPVLSDMFAPGADGGIAHIEEASRADLIVAAPATADFIARAAAGRASDLLCAVILASTCPVLLAPGMNTLMWRSPMTQANVKRLLATGRFRLVGPEEGKLACGWEGTGRMSEPEEISLWAAGLLRGGRTLAGKTIVVTAGPTVEDIDPVRTLSNRSSGRMGYAVARAAAVRGARVTLISGPTSLAAPSGVRFTGVRGAAEMEKAVLSSAGGCDALFMAAAVADWRAERPKKDKIRKEEEGKALTLHLERNRDILAQCASIRKQGRPLVVGFNLESSPSKILPTSRRKLKRKKCDLMVGNLAAESLGSEVTSVTVVDGRGRTVRLRNLPKEEIAHALLDIALDYLD